MIRARELFLRKAEVHANQDHSIPALARMTHPLGDQLDQS